MDTIDGLQFGKRLVAAVGAPRHCPHGHAFGNDADGREPLAFDCGGAGMGANERQVATNNRPPLAR